MGQARVVSERFHWTTIPPDLWAWEHYFFLFQRMDIPINFPLSLQGGYGWKLDNDVVETGEGEGCRRGRQGKVRV